MGDRSVITTLQEQVGDDGVEELEDLLASIEPRTGTSTPLSGVIVGRLVAFDQAAAIPFVIYPGQPGTAALSARATLDLHAGHIGGEVVLAFEQGDPGRPIVIGCLHQADSRTLPESEAHVEIDADGSRLVVSAQEQLVLRCGRASITLTKTGKVIIEGTYVSHRAAGVLRLKGGCVQIN
jgi:hypothetical protein